MTFRLPDTARKALIRSAMRAHTEDRAAELIEQACPHLDAEKRWRAYAEVVSAWDRGQGARASIMIANMIFADDQAADEQQTLTRGGTVDR